MLDPASDLPSHIENFLGPIEFGWSLTNKLDEVQIIKINNCPSETVISYSTLGLSRHELFMPGNRSVREEFIFGAYSRFPENSIASFLLTFSEYVISSGKALLRGDAVGPSDHLIKNVKTNSVYCTMPVLFNEGLATFYGSVPPTVFVWLVPITEAEASFIRTMGWSKFEDLLERESPDFWNLDRKSLV